METLLFPIEEIHKNLFRHIGGENNVEVQLQNLGKFER